MRKLKKEELEKVLTKLNSFIGENTNKLLTEENELYFLNKRVFLCSKKMYKFTNQIKKENLASCGCQIGKFTRSDKFKITVTALNLLSPYAIHKIWIKSSAEMNFLYKNNIIRAHMHKISENVPINQIIFVYNQNDTPLGFGLTARSSGDISQSSGKALVVVNQADTGEYIRNETLL
ncbi:ribosomal biogenesis protein [Tubulinosema ratisbonensis]|uniref:60S ribosome subunit biogenesis protein NIP7 n=1 Tax=Tubulinosema ratisbonensis TaxID=291195 RepID=A0A437AL17_9MICR|nr:ribosomal biogenesis protein [Tubulinosema ratisbonensis]